MNIVIYSGHNELVGGDAKYLVELLSNLPRDHRILCYTDHNQTFKQKFAPRIPSYIPIHYLDTRPRLDKQDLFDRISRKAAGQNASWLNRMLARWLAQKMRSRSVVEYLRNIGQRMRRILLVLWVKDFVHNYLLFRKAFAEAAPVDVFHFNNGGYPAKEAGFAAMLAARHAGIKTTIMTIHSQPRRRRFAVLAIDLCYDWLTRTCCKVVISASEHGRRVLAAERRIPLAQIETIHCGLDDFPPPSLEQIDALRRALAVPCGEKVILMVGHLDWEGKGWPVVFPALALLAERYARRPFLLIAAPGSQEARKRYEHLAKTEGVEERVRFLGFREDIALLNAVCDFAIAPYTGVEATPYAIKEAMRAAKPLVATDTGGSKEAVTHGVNGLIIPHHDPVALADAMASLLENESLCRSMGEAGRQLFEQRFLLARKIAEHNALYHRFLDA